MLLELIPWSHATKQDLINVCNGVDRTFLSGRLPDPYTVEAANGWLAVVDERNDRTGIYRAIVVDGHIVGNVSVEQGEDISIKDAELGYCLLTDYWNRNIATEAVRRVCVLAFEKLDIIRISARVNADNIASRRVLEKNGFVCEGVLRNAIVKDGKVYNMCLYGRLKEDQR